MSPIDLILAGALICTQPSVIDGDTFRCADRRLRAAQRKAEERRRATRLNDPLRRPEPTDGIRKLLASLEAEHGKLAKAKSVLVDDEAKPADRRQARIDRKDAFAAIRDLNAQIDAAWTAQTDERWLNTALSESYRLAADRDEDVSAPAIGAMRIRSRDGLLSLLEAGRLASKDDDPKRTQARYDAGCAYREMVEAQTGDLGSQMGGDGAGGGAHDNDKFVYLRLTRAKKGQLLAQIDRAVALECTRVVHGREQRDPAALQMLRFVAGQGHAITSFGKGTTMDRHVAALVSALDVAERIIRTT